MTRDQLSAAIYIIMVPIVIMSRWPTPISVINDMVWKHLSLDIRTLLNSFRKQFQKQQTTTDPLATLLKTAIYGRYRGFVFLGMGPF